MGAAWIISLTGHRVGIDRPGSSRKALPDRAARTRRGRDAAVGDRQRCGVTPIEQRRSVRQGAGGDRAGVHKLALQPKWRQARLIIAIGVTDFDRCV
jgi:hypothetical protein